VHRPAFIGRIGFVSIVALLVFSCTHRPAEPQFNNPFDPENAAGDPFRLTAQYATSSVSLHWSAPPVAGITDYKVLRSLQQSGGSYDVVGVVPATAAARQTTTDTKFKRNRINYYKVLAMHGSDINLESQVVAAGVFAPATVTIRRSTTAVGDSTVASRQSHLTLRSNFGDSVDVASTVDFASAQRFAATDTNTIIPWDLGPASGRGEKKRVFARMRSGGVTSPAVHDSAFADLTAKVKIVGAVINDTLVVRAVGTGFTRLRSVAPPDSLELAPWQVNPHPDQIDSIEVLVVLQSASLAPFVVHAEVESDFGFTRRYDLPATPLSVDTLGLTFTINNGNPTTANPLVTIVSTAKHATQMRFSENPDFTGVAWQPFQGTSHFTLVSTAGVHRVYGIFRNPFEPLGFPVSKFIELVVGTSSP